MPKRQCRAYPHTPHPATHRNGFCEQHYGEYEAAMRRFRSAVYNHKVGRTARKPPSKQDFIRTIRFTEPMTDWKRVRTADREEMLAVVAALNRDASFLARLFEDKQGFLDMKWTDWQMEVAALMRSVNRASTALLDLATPHDGATVRTSPERPQPGLKT